MQRFPDGYRQSNSESGEIRWLSCSPRVHLVAGFRESRG
jgi:hypothetical protein